jgi:site-specific DNA-cytosine methylase
MRSIEICAYRKAIRIDGIYMLLGISAGESLPHGLDEMPPPKGFTGTPKLTVKMASLIQGFPPEWVFVEKKTPAYRQVGNAFPPPVAKAIGTAILKGDKKIEL